MSDAPVCKRCEEQAAIVDQTWWTYTARCITLECETGEQTLYLARVHALVATAAGVAALAAGMTAGVALVVAGVAGCVSIRFADEVRRKAEDYVDQRIPRTSAGDQR